MTVFTQLNNGEDVMSFLELCDMISNDDLHIVFGQDLYDHLLEVNVRFKGDDARVIMIRNVYKDGSDNKPIPHFDTPSLKYIYKDKYRHGTDKGLPILIPEQFNGKIAIQGKAANRYSPSDIDNTGQKIIKTLLKEDCNIMREYWYLNPDASKQDEKRFYEIQNYLIDKYANRRF